VLGKLECDNGDSTHPLYKYLRNSLDGGVFGQGLKWNFAKFLLDAEGRPVKRYTPITNPSAIEADILPFLQ
jgi:glutathione peroxidase